jgi:hypothetical protein
MIWGNNKPLINRPLPGAFFYARPCVNDDFTVHETEMMASEELG